MHACIYMSMYIYTRSTSVIPIVAVRGIVGGIGPLIKAGAITTNTTTTTNTTIDMIIIITVLAVSAAVTGIVWAGLMLGSKRGLEVIDHDSGLRAAASALIFIAIAICMTAPVVIAPIPGHAVACARSVICIQCVRGAALVVVAADAVVLVLALHEGLVYQQHPLLYCSHVRRTGYLTTTTILITIPIAIIVAIVIADGLCHGLHQAR